MYYIYLSLGVLCLCMCRHEGYLGTIAHVWTGEEDLQELRMELRPSITLGAKFLYLLNLFGPMNG